MYEKNEERKIKKKKICDSQQSFKQKYHFY